MTLRRVLTAALIAAAGCQSQGGGLLYRQPDRADDPRFSIAEQQRRTRERYALLEANGNLAPKPYPPITGW
jgi:hypothetical protein